MKDVKNVAILITTIGRAHRNEDSMLVLSHRLEFIEIDKATYASRRHLFRGV